MRRPLTILLLITGLLCQLVATASAGRTDPAHAALHAQDVSHHHHDDGSLSFDELHESDGHMLTDQLTVAPVLILAGSQLALPALRSHRLPYFPASVPERPLEVRCDRPGCSPESLHRPTVALPALR